MDNQLAVVPNTAQVFNQIQIGDTFLTYDPAVSVSKQIKDAIKAAGFKGAEAREKYYAVLRKNVAPAVAAAVDAARAAGWLTEYRPGKVKADGRVTDFTVKYFEPLKSKVKVTPKQMDDLLGRFAKTDDQREALRQALAGLGIGVQEDKVTDIHSEPVVG